MPHPFARGNASLQLGFQLLDGFGQIRIVWIESQGTAKLFQSLLNHSLGKVNPTQIDIGKMPWLITLSFLCFFQPRHRFIQFLLLHQVDADVIVRITKFRIELNSNLALGDGLVDPALETVGPAQIGMGVCSWTKGDGFFVEANRFIQLTGHLMVHGAFNQFHGLVVILLRSHSSYTPQAPLSWMFAPLTYRASSDSKNRPADAASSTLPTKPA